MQAGESNLMAVMVYIPTPFRRFAGNQTYVKAEGKTVGDVLDSLGEAYPSLRHMIYDEADEIPGHINVYINSQEIHSLQGKDTPVRDGDEVAVIPAIAGGQVLTPEQVNRYSRHIIMPQVGPLGSVDFDVGDLSTLQRQVLPQNDDVGRPKTISAKETLNAYNPDVNVVL